MQLPPKPPEIKRMTKHSIPYSERFFAKVLITPGCWYWEGAKDGNGYGAFNWHNVKWRAHRASLKLAGIALIPGMYVDHICRVRDCVRPEHLRQVSPRANVLSNSASLQAANKIKTHCIRGHEYTDENTMHRRGWRECRECIRIRSKK